MDIAMSASMHRAQETILITGFPSALSTALCRELLTDDHENTSILLLVTPDLESAAKAFRGAFAKKRKARLTILVGDPLTASLDLSGLAQGSFGDTDHHHSCGEYCDDVTNPKLTAYINY